MTKIIQSVFYLIKSSELLKETHLEASTALLELSYSLLNENNISMSDVENFKENVENLIKSDYDIDKT